MPRGFPKAPAPRSRHQRPRRGRSGGGVILSFIVFVAVAALFGGAWLFAVGSLGDLPARDAMQQASAEAVDVSADAVEAAAAPPPVETSADVRSVDRDGIVGPRIEGPLVRAPSTVELPPPAAPEPERYKLVVIESAGVINARSHRIALAGIKAPEADETCKNASGGNWPCGARARTALRRLVRRRAVECLELGEVVSKEPVRPARCSVGPVDLSEWLVEQGWAQPSKDAPDAFASLHASAVAEGRGLYTRDGR